MNALLNLLMILFLTINSYRTVMITLKIKYI